MKQLLIISLTGLLVACGGECIDEVFGAYSDDELQDLSDQVNEGVTDGAPGELLAGIAGCATAGS